MPHLWIKPSFSCKTVCFILKFSLYHLECFMGFCSCKYILKPTCHLIEFRQVVTPTIAHANSLSAIVWLMTPFTYGRSQYEIPVFLVAHFSSKRGLVCLSLYLHQALLPSILLGCCRNRTSTRIFLLFLSFSPPLSHNTKRFE